MTDEFLSEQEVYQFADTLFWKNDHMGLSRCFRLLKISRCTELYTYNILCSSVGVDDDQDITGWELVVVGVSGCGQ